MIGKVVDIKNDLGVLSKMINNRMMYIQTSDDDNILYTLSSIENAVEDLLKSEAADIEIIEKEPVAIEA